MEIRKQVLTDKLVGITCDVCGQDCNKGQEESIDSSEYATLSAKWGYFSDGKDMTLDECHLCEMCFDKVKAYIEKLGGKVRRNYYIPFQPPFRPDNGSSAKRKKKGAGR